MRIAQCGARTVHLNGEAVRSCVYSVDAVAGAEVTTMEGLGKDGSHRLRQAWIGAQVPQCGYCQSSFIMTAAAFLAAKPKPTAADIDGAIANIRRCGTDARIRQAILAAAGSAVVIRP